MDIYYSYTPQFYSHQLIRIIFMLFSYIIYNHLYEFAFRH